MDSGKPSRGSPGLGRVRDTIEKSRFGQPRARQGVEGAMAVPASVTTMGLCAASSRASQLVQLELGQEAEPEVGNGRGGEEGRGDIETEQQEGTAAAQSLSSVHT